ncbi:MAG TPA: Stk1 family PASTA domain-containing Ser/Thr kinase [Candidatus Mediterraneibacter norfolkensis]|nr:Stk1 family PASTA domain-containing Ser/Thr kinase [Candidatus Mediterraneibacter norfolkensis]
MIKEGVFLGKRYEILGRIGSGGMADVYKGKDHKLNRYVAIKVLKSDYRSDEVFIQKFLSEAQAAAGLMHPNVVNVYDVGQDRGLYYMVMELVEGITLKDYIEKKGKLSAKETISISIQMVTGIQAAHNRHIIHRDIKPQNIIISKEGKVKVTDFGIARATTSTQTISASVMGSVHYTSPEQARGGHVDERSDIYSAGITMYEMITGHVPFDGDSTVTVALKHLQEEIVSPSKEVPDIPYSLECIILKCTQKNPEKRYSSCEELLLDLKRSLVDPDGDFVLTGGAAAVGSDRTVVMSTEEIDRIKNGQYSADDDYDDNGDYDDDYDGDDYDDEYDDDDYDEDENDEYDDRRRKKDVNPDTKKIMRILMIVASVIIAFLILFLVGNAVGLFSGPGLSTTKEEEQVEIPDLRGMTEDEATKELNDLGLGIKVENERVPSNEYDEGEVVSSDPAAGEKVDAHTTVYVTLSSGEEAQTTTVPDVVGKEEADAEKMLADANLKVAKGSDYSDDVQEGYVISCDPGVGEEVDEESTVRLVISLGSQPAEVPSIEGMSQSDAEAALSNAGLSGSASEEYSDSVAAGLVISQDTEAGRKVSKGTTISYTVSKGPEMTVVSVPDLTGMDRNTAEKTLQQAGLTAVFAGEEHNDAGAGQVFYQSVSSGTQVEEGTTVEFWVSLGPEQVAPEPEQPTDGTATDGTGAETSGEGTDTTMQW